MGFKLVEAVYSLDKDATTATEQAVLLALAFRANDKTHLCYPKQETIAEMTHLHRVTVSQCLNSLKQKGILDWKSGGLKSKRGKYGQPLSNDYTLNLKTTAQKDKINGGSSVVHDYTAVLPRTTRQCSPRLHSSVAQDYTAVLPTTTPTEHTTRNLTPIPNSRKPESGFQRAMRCLAGELLGEQPGEVRRVEQSAHEGSPLLTALEVCGISPSSDSYRDNYRAFASEMLKLGSKRSLEIVRTFASEMRQGEMAKVVNPAALLMTRLQQNFG